MIYFIYGTLNDSLVTVNTASCYLIGTTTEGELGYSENIAEYVTFGSLIFVKYRLTINNVITHPLGNVRIKLDIPELINKNTSLTSGGSINYVTGGYKGCLRRWVVTDIYSKGLMEPRGLIMSNEDLKPALQGSAFVDDVARISENNNNFHLINEDGSVNAQIRGSFFAILS